MAVGQLTAAPELMWKLAPHPRLKSLKRVYGRSMNKKNLVRLWAKESHQSEAQAADDVDVLVHRLLLRDVRRSFKNGNYGLTENKTRSPRQALGSHSRTLSDYDVDIERKNSGDRKVSRILKPVTLGRPK